MVKIETPAMELRVVAQMTIRPGMISLIAEEDMPPYKKGQVVKRITRKSLDNMQKPLTVKIFMGGGKIGYARLIIRNRDI